jgi:hypothetical protein
MEPIKFDKQNCMYADHQPEYLPLPAYKDNDQTISCWKLNIKERIKILFTGKLWLRQLNFGSPLQPQSPTIDYPFIPYRPFMRAKKI